MRAFLLLPAAVAWIVTLMLWGLTAPMWLVILALIVASALTGAGGCILVLASPSAWF